jgi:hypothetical protein
MMTNPVGVDPKAAGANDPKAVAVDPTPNVKPVADNEGGGLTGRAAAGACVNSDGAPVLNENAAPPEVDGAACLDAGAGMVSKFKPVLLPAIFVTFFLLATKAVGVDVALNTKGTAGVAFTPAGCPPKNNMCVAKDAGLAGAFVALNTMACAESVTEAEAFTPPAVSKISPSNALP